MSKIEYFKIIFISLHTQKKFFEKKIFKHFKILTNNIITLLVYQVQWYVVKYLIKFLLRLKLE
jgi:hypothetical protein